MQTLPDFERAPRTTEDDASLQTWLPAPVFAVVAACWFAVVFIAYFSLHWPSIYKGLKFFLPFLR